MSKTGVYGVVTVVQRVGAGLLACGIGREALAADDTARVDLSLPQAVAVGGGTGTAPADTGEVTVKSGIAAYFADWENRANRAQAEQPHWATPLVTVTPLLIQQVRFDTYVEHAGNGADITNLDNGKGLELIPTEMNEVQIGLPPYVIRTNPNGRGQVAGFNDWPFLLVKQRLASANEQNGNYILTLYLSVQAPIGIRPLTKDAWIITPTIGFGKGYGPFDLQGTAGVVIPTAHEGTLGTQIATNLAFQYHFLQVFWPEVEMNWNYYADGIRGGQNQVFMTFGVVFGRFTLGGRKSFSIGAGYQTAVAPTYRATPLIPAYDHAWIVTARLTF